MQFCAVQLLVKYEVPAHCVLAPLSVVQGSLHVRHAHRLAKDAMKRKTSRARSIEMEFLLRLQGQRQISKLKKPGKKCLLVVFKGTTATAVKKMKAKRIALPEKSKTQQLEAVERGVFVGLGP